MTDQPLDPISPIWTKGGLYLYIHIYVDLHVYVRLLYLYTSFLAILHSTKSYCTHGNSKSNLLNLFLTTKRQGHRLFGCLALWTLIHINFLFFTKFGWIIVLGGTKKYSQHCFYPLVALCELQIIWKNLYRYNKKWRRWVRMENLSSPEMTTHGSQVWILTASSPAILPL